VACTDDKRNAHRILVVSAERNKPGGWPMDGHIILELISNGMGGHGLQSCGTSTFWHNIMEYVIENYQEKWIGRHGTVEWPAQSCSFKLLDLCLWGCMQPRHTTTVPWK
jgi:hypothetical protein